MPVTHSLYLQTLSVAVHNHYKRVRHETSRRRLKEQQAATAAAHGVPAFVQSGKVTRSILETTTGPGITPQSPLTGPHSQPHDRFPFPPTADAGTVPPCTLHSGKASNCKSQYFNSQDILAFCHCDLHLCSFQLAVLCMYADVECRCRHPTPRHLHLKDWFIVGDSRPRFAYIAECTHSALNRRI